MSPEEIESVASHQSSKIVILQDRAYKLAATIFLNIPFEYSMNGPIGKRYDAIKDYLKWSGFKVKEWTPVFVRGGQIWAENITRSSAQ